MGSMGSMANLANLPGLSGLQGNVYAMNIDPNVMMSMFMNPHDQPHSSKQYTNPKIKPDSINKIIEISMIEAFTGCKIPVNISRWIIESNMKHNEDETIYVDIPKGIDNDEIIVLENKGNITDSSNKGDIKIKIVVNNSSKFERNGIDLVYKKTISLKDSLCGFSFDLKYIDGREFKINNEVGNIIPSAFRKIISKMGMERDGDVGNLVIIFNIEYPTLLTLEQVKELEKILG